MKLVRIRNELEGGEGSCQYNTEILKNKSIIKTKIFLCHWIIIIIGFLFLGQKNSFNHCNELEMYMLSVPHFRMSCVQSQNSHRLSGRNRLSGCASRSNCYLRLFGNTNMFMNYPLVFGKASKILALHFE